MERRGELGSDRHRRRLAVIRESESQREKRVERAERRKRFRVRFFRFYYTRLGSGRILKRERAAQTNKSCYTESLLAIKNRVGADLLRPNPAHMLPKPPLLIGLGSGWAGFGFSNLSLQP